MQSRLRWLIKMCASNCSVRCLYELRHAFYIQTFIKNKIWMIAFRVFSAATCSRISSVFRRRQSAWQSSLPWETTVAYCLLCGGFAKWQKCFESCTLCWIWIFVLKFVTTWTVGRTIPLAAFWKGCECICIACGSPKVFPSAAESGTFPPKSRPNSGVKNCSCMILHWFDQFFCEWPPSHHNHHSSFWESGQPQARSWSCFPWPQDMMDLTITSSISEESCTDLTKLGHADHLMPLMWEQGENRTGTIGEA